MNQKEIATLTQTIRNLEANSVQGSETQVFAAMLLNLLERIEKVEQWQEWENTRGMEERERG